jgi:hypothetical protein
MGLDYSDLEFDEEKYYLGTLCKRGHDWNSTGLSLRWNSTTHCIKCNELSKRRNVVEVVCDHCDKKFWRNRSKVKECRDYKHTFCSLKCRCDHAKLAFTCDICGEVFYRLKNKVKGMAKKGHKPRYCSLKCLNTSQKKAAHTIIREMVGVDKFVGSICSNDHWYNGREESLRYLSGGECVECAKKKNKIRVDRRRKPCPLCGVSIRGSSNYCRICSSLAIQGFKEEQVKTIVEEKGHKYISGYRRAGVPFKAKCGYCGSDWNAWLQHIQKGSPIVGAGCNNCATERRIKGQLMRQWKGVIEIIDSGKAPDIVVVKGMEFMDKFTELQLELNKLYREKKWREYLMKVNQMIDEHGEHLSALLVGEVRHPQFLIRDINRAANTHLGVLREHRKEVVTNAFNHPSEIPTLIEL